MNLSIIGYDPAGAWMKMAETPEELLGYRNPSGITWINVDSLTSRVDIIKLAETFGIHPLTVEDILDTEQRPKVEEFDDYIYITFKAVNRKTASRDGFHVFEQISLVLMESTVITFQEIPGDSFDGIRKRILNNAGRIRKMGTGYLAYTIMDAVVDDYILALDSLGAGIEDFEDRAIDERDGSFIQDLQKTKQNLIRMRRVVWPLRESISGILHMESKLISSDLEPFYKDVYDAVIQAVETVETYRELIAGVMEIRLSTVSNRMNSVMKVLTIISTIFIPLTFIVGVYGMNFKFMPELDMRYAYPVTWAVMIVIVIGMLLAFKRRRWL
ncbi:MAG: magnesium/cobalt transporter CorA [Treponema sp.]|jgi:magnesium transporter|nr:magnesium/cobalt transporter CorA [Treponema sp.]